MENDPGSSQGSGNFYEGQSKGTPPKDESGAKAKAAPSPDVEEKAELAVVKTETMGMTEVLKDFLENKKTDAHVHPGLSVRYTSDSQNAKGLLLNKKAE